MTEFSQHPVFNSCPGMAATLHATACRDTEGFDDTFCSSKWTKAFSTLLDVWLAHQNVTAGFSLQKNAELLKKHSTWFFFPCNTSFLIAFNA